MCIRDSYTCWEEAVYDALHFLRALAAVPTFCETLYRWGVQGVGKDTWASFWLAIFGDSSEGPFYGHQESGSYVLPAAKRDKESCDPKLMAMKDKRVVFFSEVPEHEDLDQSFLNPFSEQSGLKMGGRDIWGRPTPLRPRALAIMTSNYKPTVSYTHLTLPTKRIV